MAQNSRIDWILSKESKINSYWKSRKVDVFVLSINIPKNKSLRLKVLGEKAIKNEFKLLLSRE